MDLSEVLSTEAPESTPAVPATAGPAPGDEEVVVDGSAGEAAAKTVDAARFNGLMSAHQKALDALAEERAARIALEARTQEEKSIVSDTDNNEVALLRQELADQRMATSRAAALAKYPDAAPFADLIVGGSASEIESVAKAISERVATVKAGLVPAPEVEASTETVETAPVGTAAGTTAPAPVPMVTGGTTAPGEPTSRTEQLQAALQTGSWDGFWAAKTTPAEASNLA